MTMKFRKFNRLLLFIGVFWILGSLYLNAQSVSLKYDKYLSPKDLNSAIKGLNSNFSQKSRLIDLSKTPGNNDLRLLEIGPETGSEKKTIPAVLVVANMEGTVPVSSMAALYLADMLLNSEKAQDSLTWYILVCGNPDALEHYFMKAHPLDPRNAKPHNDDMDELVDEDGYNDLDNNGVITQMRVKDPAGIWIPLEGDPRMMKKADPLKGEKGIYKLYQEGLDDDGDGKYNEDGKGGVNVGINFPHLFKPFTTTSGLWPGCTDESFSLIKFVYEHPEIAMTFTYGSTNFCMVPPKGGRKAGADMTRIKIPKRMAPMLNADPDKTYTMSEVMEMTKAVVPPGMEVTESMVAGFLGLGAVVNPLSDDLKYYKELAEKYKEYLKNKGMTQERLDPAKAKDGSFELWSYYQLGVPTFTMDLWTLPKVKEDKKEKSGITPESLGKMTPEEFIALGKDKIAAFLKESGAPAQFKAENVIKMVEDGKMTPKQMAGMLKNSPKPKNSKGGDPKLKALLAFSDSTLGGKGFINWTNFDHPDLGMVEIGGAVSYVDNTPPADMIDSLLIKQVPWVFEITKKLPKLEILKTETKSKGGGVYELNVWVENTSYLPFPTAMGKRNKQPAPAIITIEGDNVTILSGKKRTPVTSLNGLQSKKLTWMVLVEKKSQLNINLTATNAWGDQKQIKVGGGK